MGEGFQLSQLSLAKEIIDKDAVVAAGSFCEAYTCAALVSCFTTLGEGPFQFVQKQAIDRKFFQWFDFKKPNINKLFSMFGDDTKKVLERDLQAQSLTDSVKAFLQLCNARNTLVHNNYVAAESGFTVSDTLATVITAVPFLEWLAGDFVTLVLDGDSD